MTVACVAFDCLVDGSILLVMQIKGPNVPKDALAGGGDLPDTAGLDTLGKIANKAGEKVSKCHFVCTHHILCLSQKSCEASKQCNIMMFVHDYQT